MLYILKEIFVPLNSQFLNIIKNQLNPKVSLFKIRVEIKTHFYLKFMTELKQFLLYTEKFFNNITLGI